MSAQATAEDPRVILYNEVQVPAFFDKLAAHGFQPETQEEAIEFLALGNKLLAADHHEQVKTASSRVDLLRQMNSDLDTELTRRYGAPAPQTADDEYAIKSAEYLVSQPNLLEALAALSNAA